MALTSIVNKTIFNCTGGTTYDFLFKVFEDSDLEVIRVTALGVESTLVLTTNYSVSALTETGGRVTTVATYTNGKLVVRRAQAETQDIDYTQNDTLSTDVLEEQLDKIVMMIQEIQEQIDRSLLGAATQLTALTFPAAEASKIIAWNSAATALENVTNPAVAAAASAAAASASASAASSSASSAATAKTNAETAETNAETAETNAEAAQADAEVAQAAVEALVAAGGIVKGDGTVNPTNLLSNGDFENHSAGATAVPDGFALVLTPTLATDTGDIGYGSISQKITAAGEGLEGISYSLTGLKASTTYSVSWRTKVTAGDTSQVLTTGAGTNLSATESTSTTYQTKTGTFITDASGTTVVLKLLAKADTDVVWFDGIQVNEGASAFAFSDKPVVYSDARFKAGTFTRDTSIASGDVAYTGVGFSPKHIEFSGNHPYGSSLNGRDDGATRLVEIIYGTTPTYSGSTSRSINITDGTNECQGYIKSFDADGFTITWTKILSSTGTLTVRYTAFR